MANVRRAMSCSATTGDLSFLAPLIDRMFPSYSTLNSAVTGRLI